LQWNPLPNQSESLADSIASNTPADRVKLRGELVQLSADFYQRLLVELLH
jgi:hypothetical protein